jgi:hypothetical protein
MSGGRRAVHKPGIAHERQRRCAGRQPVANWRITSGNCANCGNSPLDHEAIRMAASRDFRTLIGISLAEIAGIAEIGAAPHRRSTRHHCPFSWRGSRRSCR